MKLSEINIYPVKSLRGIALQEGLVEDRGLRHDRRWMLVDERRRFITQREVARMATVKIEVNENELKASCNGSGLSIPLRPKNGETANVQIWQSNVKAEVYSSEINGWFSEALGVNCRLVLMPETTKRRVSPFYAVRKFRDKVSFADGYPFLLIGEGSLEDLNKRIRECLEMELAGKVPAFQPLPEVPAFQPFPMNRFRPNFVVGGSEPFAEDKWKRIRIGSTEFHVVKPCARCVITTVDQTSGEKTGKEPLKTLSAYRSRNGKVMFGQNLIAEKAGGTVRVGDAIEILETR